MANTTARPKQAATSAPEAREPKYVYSFGDGKADGSAHMRDVLGGKGANLAEMTSLGIPVPPGFTITTEVCDYYNEHAKQYPPELEGQIDEALRLLESRMGAKLGDDVDPLLVSVRSGAARSMPGMMDTVLNLGLNDRTVDGLIKKTGNARFAWDAYRRFINMFGDVVMGIPHERFEHAMESAKHHKGLDSDAPDTKLGAADLQQLVQQYKTVYREATHEDFPEDPRDQLRKSINAVFNSWNNERAVRYRQLNRITGLIGTAVNVQAMVFGNMGETSGTGVAFTRDPSTGENRFYGEYLVNAQGEDVVAGIRTPEPIHRLEEDMPQAYGQLLEIRERLEQHYKDMQDVEFTVQEGTLYMLQTRSGQRTGLAAVRIACEMHDEGLIDEETALRRVLPDQLDQLLHDIFEPKAKQKAVDEGRVIGTGLPASPGAASGKVVFTADEAEQWAARGEPVVLCRVETSPEDIGGMAVAQGILTARGGMTSHAAVVARGMGRCCVAGCTGLQIEYGERRMHAGGRTIAQGEYVSIDGTTGEVIEGQLDAHPSEIVQVLVQGTRKPEEAPVYQQFMRIMEWADQYRTLKIRTNADTPEDSRRARQFGAEGIGLCRTEHMFFEDERITSMRKMILADDESARRAALSKLLPFQRDDFEGIFRAMDGVPVTVRLLDPPLHEFLPHQWEVQERIAEELGVPVEKIKDRVEQLHEMNPMLGLRGCRLGITYPEVYDMQVRAIIEAACACQKEGVEPRPEIMIPLVGSPTELSVLRERTQRIAAQVMREVGVELDYQVGTMIEVPRAALVAGEIAEHADFFSFGTNDLTQMTFGLSRDDVGPLITRYVVQGILPTDPFQSLDAPGVGQLITLGVEQGRATRTDLKVGICGEHGGDPDSVAFCHRVGMDYVSCSPFRVPIARLAAAQAALSDKA